MKLTQVLRAQHLGRYFKKHWVIQGRKFPQKTAAFKALEKENIPIYEAKDILQEEQRTIEKVEIVGLAPEPIKFDETHPNYHKRICLTYGDNNVLVEGLAQAKFLTNTVELEKPWLNENYVIKNAAKDLDARVQKLILNSHLFDAEQEKLPKVKDPSRPAFNFPRIYGVSFDRRMKLLTSRILQLIENLSDPQLTNSRHLLNDVQFQLPFEKFHHLIQFSLKGDVFLSSNSPLKPLTSEIRPDIEMPNLHPANERISLNASNIYEIMDDYPFGKTIQKRHPHTLFVHFDKTKVANIFEDEVTEDQFLSRGLIKAFTAAASYARSEFGKQVKVLPKPVTIQCVHTDGQLFHFSILQLNTLDLESSNQSGAVRNLWFQTRRMPLFKTCEYVNGRATLEEYNSDVIKHMFAFYHNSNN